MPVTRFRSIEELKATPRPLPPDDESFWSRIDAVLSWTSLSPRRPSGVTRFRSIEEADQARIGPLRRSEPDASGGPDL